MGLVRHFEDLIRPFKGLLRPLKGLTRPFKGFRGTPRALYGPLRVIPLRAL
jgi:hypothetical protein